MCRQHILKWRQVDLPSGIVFGAIEAADVQISAAQNRARLHFRGQPSGPPHGFAGIGRVSIHAKRSGGDDLQRAIFGLIDDRCGVAAERFGARAHPSHAAIVFAQGNGERVPRLIADQDNLIARDNRRRAHAVDIAEWPERQAPALVSVEPIGDEPEIAEEHVHVLAVGGSRGRGGRVQFVERLGAAAGTFAPPEDLTRGAAQAEGIEDIVIHRRDKNTVAIEYRGGMPQRQ